jgi:hypothetical protein
MPRAWSRTKGVPLIGINRGRLGFLTDVLPKDMLASVTRPSKAAASATNARCSSPADQCQWPRNARAGAQRRGAAEVADRPHAGLRNLDRRRVREQPRR